MPSARRRRRPICRACRSARAKFVAYALAGLLAAIAGLYLTFFTYTGEARLRQRQRLHALLDRRGGDRRRVAVRRHRQRHRRDLRRARLPHDRRPAVRLRHRPAAGSRCSRAWCCCSRSASARCALFRVTQQAGFVPVERAATMARCRRMPTSSAASTGGGDRVRLHPAAAAPRQPLFDATSCRPNICCSNSRWPRSSASSRPA